LAASSVGQRSRNDTLVNFFRSHNVRSQSTIARRLDAIQTEEAPTTDVLVEMTLPSASRRQAHTKTGVSFVSKPIENLRKIELFDSLPGAGRKEPRQRAIEGGWRGATDSVALAEVGR